MKTTLQHLVMATSLNAVLTLQAAITVYRTGDDFLVKSRFSDEKDIVIRITRIANEESYLVPSGSDILEYASGQRLHANADEYPATLFGSYGYLSGNHGSSFGRTVTILQHGMTDQQIGTELTDTDKNRYCIVRIEDPDNLFIHPVNTGIPGRPKFASFRGEKLFRNDVELTVTTSKMSQMYPLNRIYRLEFLLDGTTPLPDQTVMECNFLDHLLVHDVVQPEAVVDFLLNHSGSKPVPEFQSSWAMQKMDNSVELAEYAKLPILMRVENRYRYQDRGCSVLYRKCSFPVNLLSVRQMEQMFGWFGGALAPASLEDFYIPKLKPLRIPVSGTPDQVLEADFSAVYRMPKTMDVSYTIERDDYLDPGNPPDRFIRLTGKDQREYGIALGYSLFSGCTARENQGKDQDEAFFLYRSKKMYPYCYKLNDVTPGTVLESVSYKQYFSPLDDPEATAFFFHQQQDSNVVYFDCHKPLKNHRLNLPPFLTGKTLSVLEKSPSVILPKISRVPEEGICIDVDADYGFLVLK
ncbi:MAG: hypothetical protein WCT05_15285, partial [Lentisphaeria bacterium]